MAQQFARTLARAAYTLCAFLSISAAVPNAAFPFNSQVPAVARIGQRYSFQISDSTFTPEPANYVYSISSQPAWLTIDSATRTLQGIPGASDAGAGTFVLMAADGTGVAQMSCTLVVSADPAPQLIGDISKQLSVTANLSSSEPPVVTLLPSTPFKFDFGQESFIDIVQRQLFYYATLADHTPLPSWLKFNAEQLTFSGTAPDLSAFPQSWNINLIASDVAGFSGSTASFTLAIGTQQLVFVPEEQELNITAGRTVNITVLQNELFRNNVNLQPGELRSVQARTPSWLKFDSSTLELEGTAPDDFTAEDITVEVTDQLNNTARAIINLVAGESSLFNGQIGTLSAQAGQRFLYYFERSLFSQPDLDLSVDLPASANWLTFDPSEQELRGTVPSSARSSTVRATLIAKSSSGGDEQRQTFTIDVEAAMVSQSPTTRVSETNSPTSPPTAAAINDNARPKLNGGIIAAIVIASIVGAALFLFALIWCCRCRQRRDSYVQGSPRSKTISRPLQPPQGEDIVVSTSVHQDVEKDAGLMRVDSHAPIPPPKIVEPPPQIHVDGIPERRSRWLNRFSRVSQASSLGIGEDAVRQDENIPEWGNAPLHTPHDNFSIPTEMARRSTHLSETSPNQRSQALQGMRAHGRHRSSISFKRLSVGLGIAGAAAGGATGAGVARHSSRNGRSRQRRTRSSLGVLSPTREASSVGSIRTTRTSILSATPSDFAEPGRPASISTSAFPAVATAVTLDPNRKSIRMVGRSDSVQGPEDVRPDNRPLEKKRESFIKNRHRSGHMQSPLFSHGSRSGSTSLQRHGSQSIEASLAGSVRRSRRATSGWGSRSALPSQNTLTKYSESSSIEPKGHIDSPHRDSRRFSQKLRTTFVPGYPRAITRSTLFDDNDRIDEDDMSSGSWVSSKTDSGTGDLWLERELTKPRSERDWVLPNESSPITAPPSSLAVTAQDSRASTPSATTGGATRSQQWRDRQSIRERSASPLSQTQNLNSSKSVVRRSAAASDKKNRMSAPITLVSTDSMHKGRPHIGNARRPISVEEGKRLSSMRAEHDAPTAGGSERDGAWLTDVESEDETHGAGLIPPLGSGRKGDTVRSDWTGPVFL
ncbi:Putative dystroglycan-type cadherin, immunoglobulin-like, Cadherin-like superfamily [Septoria linicola]|uniref:Dystroglycan-type cadherin, immunoglobulin-like, Cadherin-like superfamily n=1 Tax=Septoria linicola TaxID=215465 RepID=A0A9Q9B7J6_9PEZI|nr:putative dystroglycan-type cadherin, immunoglobulin-like, Cadherin-like superfamily [Septoria linicola]USW58536.1 Putative dystroglycan-type cadherin, immunoglobulin-like, Cadherin-like superfamily [Septoria linicola]